MDQHLEPFAEEILEGLPSYIPAMPPVDESVPRAPHRAPCLNTAEKRLALANALRYFPQYMHAELAPEFAAELENLGHIYMHRFRPQHPIFARSIDQYPAKSKKAAAIMLMIQNNLDIQVAQYPYELVTYGVTGSVFQNWAQYRLTMKYLSELSDDETLLMYSGHPMGCFPSSPRAPRVVVTNGMVIPNYSKSEDYQRMNALGVTNYGQMTAGSYMYIGPQGIVHGTTLTIMNAGRRYLGCNSLKGKLFVTSGLGGMSGAQGKAATIAGAVSIIAEVKKEAIEKRMAQGWIDVREHDAERAVSLALACKKLGVAKSIAYNGNIVDLLEYMVQIGVTPDLASDQTSLHLPFAGGYYPAGISVEEANSLLALDQPLFKEMVQSSLRRHVTALNTLAERGTYFWDYGNAFLLEAGRAGADVFTPDGGFRYPSYVEDIMGPMCFDYGFGPFRWVCTSGDQSDLDKTDKLAANVLKDLLEGTTGNVRQSYEDNLKWILEAKQNALVVGSKARILYADDLGRQAIARAFNRAVAQGDLKGPVVIGRDHHDVSGTDSPFRETANIRDGSNKCADMAVQNVIGDACRGATWVSLHNGGGVGWGEVINGGFGMVLDGTPETDEAIQSMVAFDVENGIARRAWARNPHALETARRAMEHNPRLRITLPELCNDDLIENALKGARK